MSLIVMTNQLHYQWAFLCQNGNFTTLPSICIPSYRHNDTSVADTDNNIHSLSLYYTITVVISLTFVLRLCTGFGCASLMQTAQFGDCVCYCGLSLVFGCLNLICVVQDRAGEVWGWSCIKCCLYQFGIGTLGQGFSNLSESHFYCSSFWNVSIAVEVH